MWAACLHYVLELRAQPIHLVVVLVLGPCDVDLAVGRADADSILARASGGGWVFMCD